MTETLIYQNGGVTAGAWEEVKGAREREAGAIIWVDLNAPTGEELHALQAAFGFHDLAMQDCQEGLTKPGITPYDNYCFLTLHVPIFRERDEPEVAELNLFLGDGYLVTVHHHPVKALTPIFDHCRRSGAQMARGADFIFYALMDDITDEYFEVLHRLDDHVDELEDEIISRPSRDTLNEVFLLKRQLVHLRRITGPQREIFALLNNREFPYIKRETLLYLRDVHEHLIRVYELIDSLRDLLTGTLDIYLSQTSIHMNEVMKFLTLIATIFMPMTLISSIYGMNFQKMPELKWTYGYPLCLALMAGVAGGMLWWFKVRKWF